MASYLSPKATLTEEQLDQLITDAVPPHAYRVSPREWTWTRQTGIWHLSLVLGDNPYLKARLEGNPSVLYVCVRTTRSEIDAALRFLVAVNAIDRHPDDPTATRAS